MRPFWSNSWSAVLTEPGRQGNHMSVPWSHAAAPLGLGILAVGLASFRLSAPLEFDELYHILAARSWATDGSLAIAEGSYDRTALFTWLIGSLFWLFGESPILSRLPSVLAYALLTMIFFVWLRRTSSEAAAWLGTLLLLTSPFILELATLTRFYAIQVLCFFVATLALTTATADPRQGAAWLVAALLFAVAVYLQKVSIIGLGGLAAWLALEHGLPIFLGQPPRRRWTLFAALVLGGAGALLTLHASGLLGTLVEDYRFAPGFQAERTNEFWYYHLWLVLYYPTLWTLFPLIALAALHRHGPTARLCLVLFGTAFLVHSFAAAKDPRYLAYAWPFLFAIMAMGSVELWLRLAPVCADLIRPLVKMVPRAVGERWPATIVGAVMVAAVVLANGAAPRLLMLLSGVRVPPQPPLVRWEAAAPKLRPWLDRVEVVITTDELAALYYLGDYDVVFSSSRLTEIADSRDFARDHRTGRPVIGTADGVRHLLDCFASGLVVSGRTRLEDSSMRETAILLSQEARSLDLPHSWSVEAFVWQDRRPKGDAGACAALIARQRANARNAGFGAAS